MLGFPAPGSRVQKAYHDLWEAQNGSEERKKKLGNPANLPRPWDPTTCLERGLRWELWLWLDQVVEWINSEYVWEASGGACIPDCWPMHPHLVHELAVVADQRRRAGHAPNSDILENWHRYVLPGFIDRMRQRLKQSCDDDHQPWPPGVVTLATSAKRRLGDAWRRSRRICWHSCVMRTYIPPIASSLSSTAVT